ncbi:MULTISPECIES: flagellar basal body rod protein FlgC [Kordiimonas]|jgi:flagellar basal-body rod protein FlgC|uniref:Flagellar basal-body rod protein FlgC n=1 Tax=Kordiimonas lacus TaxID=637679 RepID=A0A1G7CMX6_9PROT|nr:MULTISPECIES: flagellar basal body rod protein FlgC [Kordiimonas]SDE40593.1 flagellar basal-body rod protein FlgC [Kordiimonas lacus]
MDLEKAMMASAAGLRAQSVRMRVISENIANQNSVASEPGADPYRRKIITFQTELDRASGVELVKPGKVEFDQKEFGKKYDPGNPAADEAGYIKTANVNGMIEMMDMRQAQRTYQSNINALEASRRMATMTLDLLR